MIKTIALSLLALGVPATAVSGTLSDYWKYDEYYALHPEQQAASRELIKAVRQTGKPVARQDKSIKVGIIYPSFQFSDYWSRSLASFELRMNELGIRYEIQARFTKPGTEVSKQVRQIETMLKWQPDYLIYTLDTARQKALVERLINSTDIKIILQNITTPIKAWGSKQPFLYTGFDHAEGAKILARYHKDTLPPGTPYSVVFRNKGMVSEMRGLTYIQEIAGEHELRSSYYTDSSRAGGHKATLQLLAEDPDVKYIYACATDTAMGIVDALAELGRRDVSVNGWGGGSGEIAALKDGDLDVVLMRMNDDNGVSMAEAIKRDLEGKAVPLIFSGDFTVLDRHMPAQELEAFEKYAFRYSNQLR